MSPHIHQVFFFFHICSFSSCHWTNGRVFITTSVAFLLVAAVHAVCIGVTAPAEGDAVAVLALELIAVTLHIAAVLRAEDHSGVFYSCDTAEI